MNKNIEIVEYNPNWPKIYEIETDKIREALGDNCLEVHHIGSTSVQGLAAKDKIDIIAEVENLIFDYTLLENLGYIFRGGFSIPLRKSFTYRSNDLNINLHIFEQGDPEIELNILFRDYLRSNAQARTDYERLKYQLIEDESSHLKKDGAMYRDYTLGKGDFIHYIIRQAGFKKLRMIICTHPKEWQAAKSIYSKYFQDEKFITDDPNYIYLVLYKGVEIVAYSAIELLQDKTAIFDNILSEESFDTEEHKEQFINLIEKWLELLDYKII